MKKITKKCFFLAALFLLLFGFNAQCDENLAQSAEETSSVDSSSSGVYSISEVDIYDAQIIDRSGEKFFSVFRVISDQGVQPDAVFGVQLVRDSGEFVQVFDEKIVSEKTDLLEKQEQKIKFHYEAPEFLHGKYELVVFARSGEGTVLAKNTFGEIDLSGSGQFIEMKPYDCTLTIKGDARQFPYRVDYGVDVSSEEEIIGTCNLYNYFNEKITVVPKLETYYRSFFGLEIENLEATIDDEVSLNPGEKKSFSFSIKPPEFPQAYDTILSFEMGGKMVSNLMPFHYVARGKGATIQNLNLDKDYYKKGDKAQLNLFWSPSADYFSSPRAGSVGTILPIANIQVSLLNGDGQQCANDVKKVIDDSVSTDNHFVKLDAEIRNDCKDPKIKVSIADEKGKLLAEKTFEVTSGEIKKDLLAGQDARTNQLIIVLVASLFLVAVLFVIIIFIIKKRMGGDFDKEKFKRLGVILVFALAAGLCFGFCNKAKAFSVYFEGVNFTASLDKRVYQPNEKMTLTKEISVATCENIQPSTSLTCNNPSSAPSQPGSYYVTCTMIVDGVTRTERINYAVDYLHPKVLLYIDQAKVKLGESIKVGYVTENADSCVASGDSSWTGNKSTSNDVSSYSRINNWINIVPTSSGNENKTLYLTCKNEHYEASDNDYVYIYIEGSSGDPAFSGGDSGDSNIEEEDSPSLELWASPSRITLGEKSTLFYDVYKMERCESIRDREGEFYVSADSSDGKHSVEVKPESAGSKNYYIKCYDQNNRMYYKETWLSVQATGDPAEVNIEVDKTEVEAGESVKLSWQVENADECSGSASDVYPPWESSWYWVTSNEYVGSSYCSRNPSAIGCKEPDGNYSKSVYPINNKQEPRTVTYTLKCKNRESYNWVEDKISVNVLPKTPRVSISVEPPIIMTGNHSIIKWTTKNAVKCYGSGGVNEFGDRIATWDSSGSGTEKVASDGDHYQNLGIIENEGTYLFYIECLGEKGGTTGKVKTDLWVTNEKLIRGELVANPDNGVKPLTSILTARRTAGTTIGPITYEFYCDGKTENEPDYVETTNASQASHTCLYNSAGVITAKAKITQEGVSIWPSANITVTTDPGPTPPGPTPPGPTPPGPTPPDPEDESGSGPWIETTP